MRGTSKALAACLAAGLVVSGCETTPPVRDASGNAVTIPYNPYKYDPDELQRQAEAHCASYGRHAVYVDETIDPSSVRWRYRHFDCVDR